MKPNLINFNSITKEIKQLAYIQNSKYFNYILLVVFIICFTVFIIIFQYETKYITRKYTIKKLKKIRDELMDINKKK